MVPVDAYNFCYGSALRKYKKRNFKDSTKKKRFEEISEDVLDDTELFIFKQVAMYGFIIYRAAYYNSMDKRHVEYVFRRALRKLRMPKSYVKATGINLFKHEGEVLTASHAGTRVRNILKKQGITTIGDLQAWANTSPSALFNIPGIGMHTIPRLIGLCEPTLY